jgi:hypothetical protein
MTRKMWIAVVAAVLVAVAVVAFVSYGSLGHSGTPRQQLTDWVDDTGLGQELGALHHDGLDVDKVLARHAGSGAMRTVCSVLSVTAESAHANLPSPDTEVTQWLARAYTLEYEAGNDCYAAGTTNTRLLKKSAAERAQAQRIFAEVLARVGTVTGASVATTTTTVPTTGTGIFG